jgi:hypothetical protein
VHKTLWGNGELVGFYRHHVSIHKGAFTRITQRQRSLRVQFFVICQSHRLSASLCPGTNGSLSFKKPSRKILVESMRTWIISNCSINQVQINSPNSFKTCYFPISSASSYSKPKIQLNMSKYYRAPTAEMTSTRSCRAPVTDITNPYRAPTANMTGSCRAPVADMTTQYRAPTANMTGTGSGSYSPRCYKAPEARMY